VVLGVSSVAQRSEFNVDRSKPDGLVGQCLRSRRGHHGRPAYDPDRRRARSVVERAVRSGWLSRPRTVACADCGHRGADVIVASAVMSVGGCEGSGIVSRSQTIERGGDAPMTISPPSSVGGGDKGGDYNDVK
jgi:hypothetical protein